MKFKPIYLLSRVINDFLMKVTIKLKINTTQTRFSKNLPKSALWPGPYKIPIFRSTHKKDLKLGQCLDMDDMKSPSKFSVVT